MTDIKVVLDCETGELNLYAQTEGRDTRDSSGTFYALLKYGCVNSPLVELLMSAIRLCLARHSEEMFTL